MKKKASILLIVQAILMYLVQVPFYVALIGINFLPSESIGTCFLVGFISSAVLLYFCLVSFVIGIVTGAKQSINSVKTALVIKIVLIPFYLVNFFIGFLLIAGTLNPFLIWSAPIIFVIIVGMTYMFMITTSVHPFAYTVVYLLKNKIKPNTQIVVGLICLLIFCIDWLGCALLYNPIYKDSIYNNVVEVKNYECKN